VIIRTLSDVAELDGKPVKLGICVLNWNAGDVLIRCVEHLRIACASYDTELLVVDNKSSDGSLKALATSLPAIAVIQSDTNVGYPKGNNLGARHLLERGCTALLFVNPDVLVQEHSITALLDVLRREPDAGCVGGLPTNGEGVSRMACRARPSALGKIIHYGPLARLCPERFRLTHFLKHDSLADGARVYAVCGACILFRARAFEDAGGFDEATFLYEEEFVISERLRAHNWFVVLSPRCVYFHSEGHSTSKIPYLRRLYFIESEQHLVKSYYGWGPIASVALNLFRRFEWLFASAGWWLKSRFSASPPNRDAKSGIITTGHV
jgi:GT2 family glycosyltransferase